MSAFEVAMSLLDRGLLPDAAIRAGIRALLRARLATEGRGGVEAVRERQTSLLAEWQAGPIAVATHAANEQHYELPPEFFAAVLGPRLKYSSCLWPAGVTTLTGAEEAMLEATCERACLVDGQEVLELGCGWGSLTLWIAEHYPDSRILALSNSKPQREFITRRAAERGLANVEIVTADINGFATDRCFDRIVSVEMFEHLRNHRELMRRIAGWLADDGRLFVHIFCHRRFTYPFETEGAGDWMARHFFTGGVMPSEELLLAGQDALVAEQRWAVSGLHYARTLRAWLERQDAARNELIDLFAAACGSDSEARRWFERWRVFFLACAELFAWGGGNEWYVAHARFRRR